MTCKGCEIKGSARKIYEDEKTVVVMSPTPLAAGHIIVLSRDHYPSMDEVPIELISHFYYVASFAASAIFEAIQDQRAGTNIIVNDGKMNDLGHFAIHIIPRKEDDGLDFRWELKQADMKELDATLGKLKEETFFIGKDKAPEKMTADLDEAKPEIVEDTDEENYLVKQLTRIP